MQFKVQIVSKVSLSMILFQPSLAHLRVAGINAQVQNFGGHGGHHSCVHVGGGGGRLSLFISSTFSLKVKGSIPSALAPPTRP